MCEKVSNRFILSGFLSLYKFPIRLERVKKYFFVKPEKNFKKLLTKEVGRGIMTQNKAELSALTLPHSEQVLIFFFTFIGEKCVRSGMLPHFCFALRIYFSEVHSYQHKRNAYQRRDQSLGNSCCRS